jgi:hypothetical protein
LGCTYDRGKILIIDVDNINFVDNPEDLGIILNKIDAELNGLFNANSSKIKKQTTVKTLAMRHFILDIFIYHRQLK